MRNEEGGDAHNKSRKRHGIRTGGAHCIDIGRNQLATAGSYAAGWSLRAVVDVVARMEACPLRRDKGPCVATLIKSDSLKTCGWNQSVRFPRQERLKP